MDPTSDPFLDESAAAAAATATSSAAANNHGWQKVTYAKRQRRPAQASAGAGAADPDPLKPAGNGHVFASVEQKSQDRRRALEAAAAAAAAAAAEALYKPHSHAAAGSSSDDDSGAEGAAAAAATEAEKKPKVKKPKKPKVTVPEAAAKIDAGDLSAFLIDVSGSYESQQDIQLMRFADYFGRAFAAVSASQFPWAKMFKESPVSKIIDTPLCYISDSVYKTSSDWISEKSAEALGDFILWCLDSILADLASQQVPAKGSKKPVQKSPSKSQVAIFVVLAMTLRRKPDLLISLVPKLKDNPKYQGQEKFPLIVWVIGQASQGDLVVGMYAWVHYLLPLICGKSNINPQSRDLALQLVERILSGPKARPILLNGAVRKGERLVPPSALDLLMRATFPVPSARVKATERFEAAYPVLKELALTGSPGTKSTKQASQQLLPSAVKAMQENNEELRKEATDVFIWCLIQNADCYRQWEKIHLDNVEASLSVLCKLSEEWKGYSSRLSSDALRETLKNLRAKNEQALSGAVDAGNPAYVKDADKYCKVLLGRLSRGSSCVKGGVVVLLLAVAVGFAVSPNMESWDLSKLHAMLGSPQSSL